MRQIFDREQIKDDPETKWAFILIHERLNLSNFYLNEVHSPPMTSRHPWYDEKYISIFHATFPFDVEVDK